LGADEAKCVEQLVEGDTEISGVAIEALHEAIRKRYRGDLSCKDSARSRSHAFAPLQRGIGKVRISRQVDGAVRVNASAPESEVEAVELGMIRNGCGLQGFSS
jgi:hypothetical protein